MGRRDEARGAEHSLSNVNGNYLCRFEIILRITNSPYTVFTLCLVVGGWWVPEQRIIIIAYASCSCAHIGTKIEIDKPCSSPGGNCCTTFCVFSGETKLRDCARHRQPPNPHVMINILDTIMRHSIDL